MQIPDQQMGKRYVIAGGRGFLGRLLAEALVARGDAVVVLSRRGGDGLPGVTYRVWDNETVGDWVGDLDGCAGLINLVGKSVDCRKTPAERKEIFASRVDSCRVLGEALQRCDTPPRVWVQAGTAHRVGDPLPEDVVCDEQTPLGEGLAPEVARAWEEAYGQALLPGQRGVMMWTSFVLGREGGALARLNQLTRWGLGGTVGSGRQWISWIHESDWVRLTLAMLDDVAYEGSYMVTAPNPVTNRAFMGELRRAWGRPWSPPAPALAVRLGARWLLRTDPELALLGRRCVPTRLEKQGFEFDWPDLPAALDDLVRG